MDPEHPGLDQLAGAAVHPALHELLQAGDARLQQAVGQQAGRQEVPEDRLDLLGGDEGVGVLHQALAALHEALLQAGGQQVGHALQLAAQDGALQPQVGGSEEARRGVGELGEGVCTASLKPRVSLDVFFFGLSCTLQHSFTVTGVQGELFQVQCEQENQGVTLPLPYDIMTA